MIVIIVVDNDVSSHSVFLPGISTFVTTMIPTALASRFSLLYFPYFLFNAGIKSLRSTLPA
jgi:hypothetical protein